MKLVYPINRGNSRLLLIPPWLASGSEAGTIIVWERELAFDSDKLLQFSCDWMQDYLKMNAEAEDKTFGCVAKRYLTAFAQVITSPLPVKLEPEQTFKLQSMGLVQVCNHQVTPSCKLYSQYFGRGANQGNTLRTGHKD